MNRGKFIVFEGINGSGKTTLINHLYNKLSFINIKVKIIKFPNRTTNSGIIIDKFLKNEYHFDTLQDQIKIFAENRKECRSEIEELLNNKYIILCDRYIYSNIAYTLTDQTFNIINNNHDDKILSIYDIIKYDNNLIKPDCVILINGDYIHLRHNEIKERYHQDKTKNIVIFNNYLLSFKLTDSKFYIINNELNNITNNVELIYLYIQFINNTELLYF
jgi:dTMP kinase